MTQHRPQVPALDLATLDNGHQHSPKGDDDVRTLMTQSARAILKKSPKQKENGDTILVTSPRKGMFVIEDTMHVVKDPHVHNNGHSHPKKKKTRKKSEGGGDSDGETSSGSNDSGSVGEGALRKKDKDKDKDKKEELVVKKRKPGGSMIIFGSAKRDKDRNREVERKREEFLASLERKAKKEREKEKEKEKEKETNEININDKDQDKEKWKDELDREEKMQRYELEKRREKEKDSRLARTESLPVNIYEIEKEAERRKRREREKEKEERRKKKEREKEKEKEKERKREEKEKEKEEKLARRRASTGTSSKKFGGSLSKAASKKRPPPLPPGVASAPTSLPTMDVPPNQSEELNPLSPRSAAAVVVEEEVPKKRRFYSLSTRRKHRRSASYPSIPIEALAGLPKNENGNGNGNENGKGNNQEKEAEDERKQERELSALVSPRRRVVSVDFGNLSPRSQSKDLTESHNPSSSTGHKLPAPSSAPELGHPVRGRSKTIATLQKFGATIRVTKKKHKDENFMTGNDWTDIDVVVSPTKKPSQSERAKAERQDILREIQVTQFDTTKLFELLTRSDLILAQAMCNAMPRTGREIALTNIFGFFMQNSLCIPLLIKLVHEEVEATFDASTLFRSNNITSSLLSLHAKSGARNYLRHTLEPIVADVCNCGLHFELDPTKLEIRGIVDQDTEKNCDNVVAFAEKCLISIRNSLPYCPTPVRKMCKTLQLAVAEKFPQHTETVVGGYYFLRFICPALVSPDVYGVLSEGVKVTPVDRRALLLISKTLQQLANGVPFGSKESYMTLMNPFILNHQEFISSLFQELAVIPLESEQSLVEEEPCKEGTNEEENYRIFFYTFFRDNLAAVEEKLKAIPEASQLDYDPIALLKELYHL